MIRKILVGFDGSESARKALRFGHDLSQQLGAKLAVLFVLELPHVLPIAPFDSYVVTAPPRPPEEIEAIRRLLDEAVSDLKASDVEKRVELGRAADVICEQGRQMAADLIVIGARGLGAGGRWLLGSVSDRIVHQADRPVTVVH